MFNHILQEEFSMARSFKFITGIVLMLASCFISSKLSAQPGNPQQGNSPQVNWSDSLRAVQEESRALRNILSAIESIDTARQSELIQWIITDRSVRSRVISALRKAGKNISPSSNAELLITQKPPTKIEGELNNQMDLLKIVIESIGVYGTPQIKRILGQDLYDKINNRADYEYTMISTEQDQQRIQYVNISASIFGGDIIFKSGFGFGMNVGYDYLGWPFWVPGNVGVFGIIHLEMTDVRIGLNFPLGEAGLTPFTLSGGLRIKQRILEGTQGFHAQVEQMLNVISDKKNGRLAVGGEFFNSFVPSSSTFSQRAADTSQLNKYRTSYPSSINGVKKDSLYYLSMSGHAWFQYSFGESLRGAYVQLGGGMHRVNAVTIGTKSGQPSTNVDLVNAGSFNQFDPLIKIGFNHNAEGGYDYGVSLQYCNELLADGYVRIFTWLNLELKYAAVVFRDPKKWELTDFFIITPVLKLNF